MGGTEPTQVLVDFNISMSERKGESNWHNDGDLIPAVLGRPRQQILFLVDKVAL